MNFTACSFIIARQHIESLTRDIDIEILSVRLSVVGVPVFHGNGLTYCQNFFTTQYPDHFTQCLKKLQFLFLSELRQISTDFNKFW